MVASAQARSWARDEADITVIARASRSQRSGPTGRPAECRAAPKAAAVTAASGAPASPARTSSVNGGDHPGESGLADRLLVLGVLQDRAEGLAGHRQGPR